MRYRFEDFELDTALFELRQGGRQIALEPQVFDVLSYLVQHHERVVTKDELIEHIWPERYITEAALNSRLMAARKALGDSGREQRLIRTLHGRGFRFVGDVLEVEQGGPIAEPGGQSRPEPEAQGPAEPARTPAAGSRSALAASTTFVGREAELARLEELLDLPGCRLITVVGPGGVGKSRLAAMAAQRYQARTGTQVVSVALEHLREPEEMPVEVAVAMGLSLQQDDVAGELIARIAHRRLLLVLDNFEQLSGAAELLSEMLNVAPGIRLLVTSRAVLGLAEEWLFTVGGLSTAPDDAGTSDAMRLFLDRRRQAVAQDSTVPAADVSAIAEICRLVDGMPLALELAASLSRYLPYADIANHIASDSEFLKADLRNIPQRHRSIPALLAESIRNLSVHEVRALLSLSVFEGGFGVEAASEVAGASLKMLVSLTDLSLVQPREGRFALHPLMRQFARERLEDAFAELQEMHAFYFASMLHSREQRLEAGDQLAAAEEIDPEMPNIVAAWRWAAAHRRFDLLDRGLNALTLYMQYRSRFVESIELLTLALDALRAAGEPDPVFEGRLLSSLGWANLRLSRGAPAHAAFTRYAAIIDEIGRVPVPGIGGDPAIGLGVLAWGAGDYVETLRLAEGAIDAARDRGDELALAMGCWCAAAAILRQAPVTWVSDGHVGFYVPEESERSREMLRKAGTYLHEAAELLERRGERWFRGFVETELGWLTRAQGDDGASVRHSERALEMRRAFGDTAG